MKTTFIYLLFFLLLFSIFISCKQKVELPISYTTGTKFLSIDGVTAYGSITGRGITAKGFCWDTLDNPTLLKNTINLGENSQSYSYDLTGLKFSKKYYLIAYATNSEGTAYGSVVSFSTLVGPTILTFTLAANSFSSAVAYGSVAITSTFTPSETGICFGLNKKPDVSGTKISNGANNYFSANLTNLQANQTYYVRAYGTYSFGTLYGPEVNFTTPSAPIQYSVSGTMTDADGNTYNTVTIGNQTWMAENLRVTQFNDGSNLPLVAYNSWGSLSYGARCNYADNTGNTSVFGYMYNFRAVADIREIAPVGWHLPTIAEWQTLFNKLGGSSNAMSQLMALNNSWPSSSCVANNYSSMSLLPGGFRASNGGDNYFNSKIYFWANKTENSSAYIFDNYCAINLSNGLSYNVGCYIRCVKD